MSKNIAIIGAGVAGLFCALGFTKNNHKVSIFSKTRRGKRKPGELLSPEVRKPLSRYGLLKEFESRFKLRSSGSLSVWESDVPYHVDAIIKPEGGNYIVSRQEFECFLMASAVKKGVEFIKNPERLSISRMSDGFQVSYRDGCNLKLNEFDYLVEATGKTRGLIGHGKRTSYDNLVALVAYIDTDCKFSRNLFLESVENGWFYLTMVSENKAVIAYMTDNDLLPLGRQAKEKYFIDSVSKTSEIYPIIETFLSQLELNIHSACTSKREKFVGTNWAAVGDAAISFDPICGRGMLMAAMSGHALTNTLTKFDNFNESVGLYEDAVHKTFRSYLISKRNIYAAASHRHDSIFWNRRIRTLV